MKKKEVLTVENAKNASTVSCIAHPEWGVKRFSYHSEHLGNGSYCSSVGSGCNSSLLFESEFRFWQIESYK